MKLEYRIWFVILGVLLLFLFLGRQVDMYHTWVKRGAIEDYSACRVFNELPEGEDYCKSYAKGNANFKSFSPYPWWKALVFINPNHE